MGDTTIAWTDKTWNPTTGCSKVSQGCKNCYAERIFHRPYPGRAFTDVRCHPERLDQPLRWRKPRRIFVNSMSDLFHEDVPDQFICDVFTIMRDAGVERGHVFQVLTKRPERMLAFAKRYVDIYTAPQPRVWLGVSVEDQATADERIPLLLQTPAAVRFVSYEPALGPVDFRWGGMSLPDYAPHRPLPQLNWVIVGGESGPRARGFRVQWARDTVKQCKAAGVACFVKQLGAFVVDRNDAGFDGCDDDGWPDMDWAEIEHDIHGYHEEYQGADCRVHLRNRSGAEPAEWPKTVRVREFPQ